MTCLFAASKCWVLSILLKRALPRGASRRHRSSPSPFYARLRAHGGWALLGCRRVIWHDDQILSHVEIGIGTHVAVSLGPLRIEEVLKLVADAFANDKADNCPICAIDEHVVDYAEQSSTTRNHLVTDDVETSAAGSRAQPILVSSQIHAQSLHQVRSNTRRKQESSAAFRRCPTIVSPCATTKPATRSPSRCTMISLIYPRRSAASMSMTARPVN